MMRHRYEDNGKQKHTTDGSAELGYLRSRPPFVLPAMATTTGRKKSIVSSTGLQIDTPVANNTVLNKAAGISLYQECVQLRTKLMRIRGFGKYFALVSGPDSRQSTDPVTQLWDLFSHGIPLCYIFDQLELETKINNSDFNPDTFEANPDRAKKHAIAMFAMQVRSSLSSSPNYPGCETFTVTDLWDRSSTDGLVKVIRTVSAMVACLPESALEEAPPSPPYLVSHDSHDSLADTPSSLPPATGQEAARNNIIRELVETERKYVQDLEVMQVKRAFSHISVSPSNSDHSNTLLSYQKTRSLIRIPSISSSQISNNFSTFNAPFSYDSRAPQSCNGRINAGDNTSFNVYVHITICVSSFVHCLFRKKNLWYTNPIAPTTIMPRS